MRGSVDELRQCGDVQVITAGSGTRSMCDRAGGLAQSDEVLDAEGERMCGNVAIEGTATWMAMTAKTVRK